MAQKIRILQVLSVMNRGGAETMLMNYYRILDRNRYQFDFLVHRKERGSFDDEIESMGGRIYRAFPIRPWNYASYFSFLNSFFKEHASEYVAVHTHIQENGGFVLKYAAKYGIKNRLTTSHIADLGIDYKYPFRVFAKCFNKYITTRLACGYDAGKFLYGNKSFQVFPNAINTHDFLYNPLLSETLRQQRQWTDKFVIGNVGRLNPQKNHSFLLDIFKEIQKFNESAVLVLVGDGFLRKSLENKVKDLGLTNYVFFEGVQNNVSDYLNIFDVFVFPSLYEGLPVSIIEAQASGLKCFLSDTIDRTVDITGDITFMSLNASPKVWAEEIMKSLPYKRPNNQQKVEEAGYDVHPNIENLLNLYTQNV